jgi:hypothetical protein
MVMKFWVGYSVPAGTPQPVVDRLNKEIVAAVHAPGAKKRFTEMGVDAVGNTTAEATQLVSDEIERWTAVIKAAGIKPQYPAWRPSTNPPPPAVLPRWTARWQYSMRLPSRTVR